MRALLVDGGEGFVGGAKKRSGFIEDDGDRDIAEKAFEFPLVLEGVKENAIFHFFQDFYGDAAGDVDTTERENFQGEISGFGAVDGGPEIQRIGTDPASFVQAAAGDLRSGVGVASFERSMESFWVAGV